eukprot:jgi/Botrbrau1/22095/Bobra.0206s0021.1
MCLQPRINCYQECLVFDAEDLSRHNTVDDCYIAIGDSVYDVTKWITDHPGGDVLLSYAGRDATDVFTAFHSDSGWSRLKDFRCGQYVGKEREQSLIQDFRTLRASIRRRGLFSPKFEFFGLQFALLILLLCTTILLLAQSATSWPACVAAGCIMGLFMQQSAWLAHDILHHQVFREQKAIFWSVFLVGEIFQGLSSTWWTTKHNVHHATPNHAEKNAEDGRLHAIDPDIDTMPYLAWTPDMLVGASQAVRKVVAYQQYYFFALLPLARFIWVEQAFEHMTIKYQKMGFVKILPEATGMLLHYLLFVGIPFLLLPTARVAAYYLAAQAFGGIFLSIVFVQSHNGKKVFVKPVNFYHAQVVCSRNITPGIWNDWFSGGLNYQIEHHLFPTLPRHNYPEISKEVRRICEKHGIPYDCCTVAESTWTVLKFLGEVARHRTLDVVS